MISQFLLFILPFLLVTEAKLFASSIQWRPYLPKFLKPHAAGFYKYRWEAEVLVPLSHLPLHRQDSRTRGKSMKLYVRKFSNHPIPLKHIWFITGGPGCSTSGIERALTVQIPDAAIYIMDNRGLESSEAVCTYEESKDCVQDPEKCFETYQHPSHAISLHETALDYNHLSQLIIRNDGGQVFLYGSSYGSILAYRAFKFNPRLYSGILLEAFMPSFSLSETADIRNYVTQSCLKSEVCRSRFPLKSEESIANLMSVIMDPTTSNPCKLLFSLLHHHSKGTFYTSVSSVVRFLAHKRSQSRGVILPMLFSLAHCPSIDDFVKFMSHYYEMYSKYSDDIPDRPTKHKKRNSNRSSTNSFTPTAHASLYPQTNSLIGAHIRLSEYFADSRDKAKYCVKNGFLNAANWADTCGMVIDYRPVLERHFYRPEYPQPKREDLLHSATRIVIFTGKWDTQTPHDLAQEEFDSLLAPNKFIFTADHAAHGVIDSADVDGLHLGVVMDFVMTGSQVSKARITNAIKYHNSDPDRVWRHSQRDEFPFRSLWDFAHKPRNYSMNSFLVVLIGSFVPPLLTFVGFYRSKKI